MPTIGQRLIQGATWWRTDPTKTGLHELVTACEALDEAWKTTHPDVRAQPSLVFEYLVGLIFNTKYQGGHQLAVHIRHWLDWIGTHSFWYRCSKDEEESIHLGGYVLSPEGGWWHLPGSGSFDPDWVEVLRAYESPYRTMPDPDSLEFRGFWESMSGRTEEVECRGRKFWACFPALPGGTVSRPILYHPVMGTDHVQVGVWRGVGLPRHTVIGKAYEVWLMKDMAVGFTEEMLDQTRAYCAGQAKADRPYYTPQETALGVNGYIFRNWAEELYGGSRVGTVD